jgi:hypothetical protein
VAHLPIPTKQSAINPAPLPRKSVARHSLKWRRRLIHKPVALTWRQRRSYIPSGLRLPQPRPAGAFVNKPYHFSQPLPDLPFAELDAHNWCIAARKLIQSTNHHVRCSPLVKTAAERFNYDYSDNAVQKGGVSSAYLSRRVSREVQHFENLAAQIKKFRAAALARAREIDADRALDAAGARSHDDDSVTHVDRFINVVRDE